MARPCTIRDHSACTDIDKALVAGEAPKMKQYETLSSRARAHARILHHYAPIQPSGPSVWGGAIGYGLTAVRA